MAIFPLRNSQVANYDCLKSNSFKAGMVLIRDSNGFAVKADRSSFTIDFLSEQRGRFLGFASGDHDVINNIILSDPVGSSFVDSNGRIVDNPNSHYGVYKRSIAEFSDENVSRYYNIYDSALSTRRGVGVFNLVSEIYITDQFAPVLALTFSGDDRVSTTLSPGDLLTFGAGINAGKLVKVDQSGNGPSVLVVGVVEKYDSGTGLLTFRHILSEYNNTVSYSSAGLYLNLDASSNVSYPGSGTVWYDLSGNNINGQIRNGAYYSSDSGGVITLDGADDDVFIDYNALMVHSGDFTIEVVFYPIQQILTGFFGRPTTYGTGNRFVIGSFLGGNVLFWNPLLSVGGQFVSGITPMYVNNWYSIVATRNSGVLSLYLNGVFEGSAIDTTDYTSTRPARLSYWASWVCAAKIASVRMYSVGMTPETIQRNHNAIYPRLVS